MTDDLDLCRPSDLKAVLGRHGIHLTRRFGQHFLTQRHALERIVAAACLTPEDTVLEVGPGAGVLTVELARVARRVHAVELDRDLLPVLDETLKPYPAAHVVSGDALRLDWEEFLEGQPGVKVVANIPYNITSPLLVRFLERKPAFASLTLLVQREVADRVCALPNGDAYGSLTVFVRYHASARIVCAVPRGAFFPPPRVDSAVLHLVPHPLPTVDADPETFFRVTRAAFGQRRKVLRNALSSGLDLPRDAMVAILDRVGIEPNARAEQLDLPAFAAIARALDDSVRAASL